MTTNGFPIKVKRYSDGEIVDGVLTHVKRWSDGVIVPVGPAGYSAKEYGDDGPNPPPPPPPPSGDVGITTTGFLSLGNHPALGTTAGNMSTAESSFTGGGKHWDLSSDYYSSSASSPPTTNWTAIQNAIKTQGNAGRRVALSFSTKYQTYLEDIGKKSGPGWTWFMNLVNNALVPAADYMWNLGLELLFTVDHEWEGKTLKTLTGISADPTNYGTALGNMIAYVKQQSDHLYMGYWYATGSSNKLTIIDTVGKALVKVTKPHFISHDPYNDSKQSLSSLLTANGSISWIRQRSWWDSSIPLMITETGAHSGSSDATQQPFFANWQAECVKAGIIGVIWYNSAPSDGISRVISATGDPLTTASIKASIAAHLTS